MTWSGKHEFLLTWTLIVCDLHAYVLKMMVYISEHMINLFCDTTILSSAVGLLLLCDIAVMAGKDKPLLDLSKNLQKVVKVSKRYKSSQKMPTHRPWLVNKDANT